MKKRTAIWALLSVGAAGSPAVINAQINSPSAEGYMARGVAMYHDRNYDGCIDQLLQVRNLDPATAQREEALYYMAMSTLYCGDDEALTLLEDFMRQYPQSPMRADVLTAIGDYYFTRGGYSEALQAYDRVAEDALALSRREDMLYRKAYSLLLLGEGPRARTIFEKLVQTSAYGNAASFYLGYISYIEGNYDRAMVHFRKVDTSREPGTAADYYIAQICFLDKDYSQALQLARKMLGEGGSVDQFRPEMNRVAGESLYNLGREGEAVDYLRHYVAGTADVRPSACYILGVWEFNEGRYDEAIHLLRQAAGMPDAMGQSAYLYLGQAYVKTGNADGALLAFESAYRDNYDPRVAEEAFYNYIVARLDGGRVPFGKSVSMMEEFLKKYPRSRYSDDIRQNLVTGFMSDNDYESALRIINSTPNPSERMTSAKQRVLFMMGSRDLQSGRVAQAIDALTESAAMEGGDASVHRQALLWLGNALLEADQLDEAAAAYLNYLEVAPAPETNRTVAYYNLGYTRFRQGRFGDAAKDFRRVADSKSVSKAVRADALNRMADCLYYENRPGEAAKVYTQAYETNPESGDYAMYQAALMKGRTGDHDGLVSMMDALVAKFPKSSLVPSAMLEKGRSLVEADRIPEALEVYMETATAYPSTQQGRNAYLELAVTNQNAGNEDAAAKAYQEVIRLYPTSDEAKTAIEDLKQIAAASGRLKEFAEFVNSVPNAPQVDVSTLDGAAFSAAEQEYVDLRHMGLLTDYLSDYPEGVYRPQALYYLAEAALEGGKEADGMEYITEILTEYPDADVAEEVLLLKAETEMEQDKDEVALNTYRQLEGRASTPRMLTEARMGMMRASIALKHYDEAMALARQLESTSAPGSIASAEVRCVLAEALAGKGQREEAETIWAELSRTPGDVFGAKSAVFLAQSLLDRGDAERAQATADALINAGTPHNYWLARAYIVLSDALRAQGQAFEADEYLKSLKSNYPDTDEDIFLMINDRLNK